MLESDPIPNIDVCKTLRYLSKLHKQRIYNKQSSVLYPEGWVINIRVM